MKVGGSRCFCTFEEDSPPGCDPTICRAWTGFAKDQPLGCRRLGIVRTTVKSKIWGRYSSNCGHRQLSNRSCATWSTAETILLETECLGKDVPGVTEEDDVPVEENLEFKALLLRLSVPATLIMSGNCSCNKKWLIFSLLSVMVLCDWVSVSGWEYNVWDTANIILKYGFVIWMIFISARFFPFKSIVDILLLFILLSLLLRLQEIREIWKGTIIPTTC